MKLSLDENQPIYLQVKEYLENAIINSSIEENERIPSTNEFAKHYKINPATAAKGVNELVAEEIIVKRRGVGMFVAEGAKGKLIDQRKQSFFENYILPLKKEANKLNISKEQLIEMMNREEQVNEN